MALIEVFHLVASQYPIDANNTTDIPQGSLVSLDTSGNVVLPASISATNHPVGIAADSRSQGVTSYTPESATNTNAEPPTAEPPATLIGSLVIGAYGDQQRYTQNRVADNYNEVLASGKMSVYHSGGEFWTDQYNTADTFTPSVVVYAAVNGNFADAAVNGAPNVGVCITSPTGYPSGVPGTGPNAVGFSALPEGGNSLQWGTFLHVKLGI